MRMAILVGGVLLVIHVVQGVAGVDNKAPAVVKQGETLQQGGEWVLVWLGIAGLWQPFVQLCRRGNPIAGANVKEGHCQVGGGGQSTSQ